MSDESSLREFKQMCLQATLECSDSYGWPDVNWHKSNPRGKGMNDRSRGSRGQSWRSRFRAGHHECRLPNLTRVLGPMRSPYLLLATSEMWRVSGGGGITVWAIVYTIMMKQFLQIGQLDRVLLLLGLALCLLCTSESLVLFFGYILQSLPFSELSLVGLALHLVNSMTIVLQCYHDVGWVIWPVKSFPKLTNNVLNGTVVHSTYNSTYNGPYHTLPASIFTARRYAIERCLFGCLSHARILSKRLNTSSNFSPSL